MNETDNRTMIEEQIESLRRRVERRAPPSSRGSHALNPRQEAFAQAVVRGLNGVEAARTAGYGGTPESLATTASKLHRTAKVRHRIQELQTVAAIAAEVTLDRHLQTLAELRDSARQSGQIAAAVRAEELRGKVAGLYEAKEAGADAVGAQMAKLTAEEQVEMVRRAIQRIEELTGATFHDGVRH